MDYLMPWFVAEYFDQFIGLDIDWSWHFTDRWSIAICAANLMRKGN